jgi:hypothetical protein
MEKTELIHLVNLLQTALNAMVERQIYAENNPEARRKWAWSKENKVVNDLLQEYKEKLDDL